MEELMNHGGTEVTEKTVKERPILFSGPMVRAILDGRKTQTRRIINPQPFEVSSVECGMYTPTRIDRHGEMYPGADVFGVWSETDEEWGVPCPYGQPGDRLWVRESFYTAERYPGTGPDGEAIIVKGVHRGPVHYAADGPPKNTPNKHYPAGLRKGYSAPDPYAVWVSRPSIHMPRWASRITLEVKAVRVERLNDISNRDAKAEGVQGGHQRAFKSLWNSINGSESWDANPWVWVVEFQRI